jgi:hypothetical protein
MFHLHIEFLWQCMPAELHLQVFYPFSQFYVTEYVSVQLVHYTV